jgi:chorismate lyase/3-hydroxybenzoate synthase
MPQQFDSSATGGIACDFRMHGSDFRAPYGRYALGKVNFGTSVGPPTICDGTPEINVHMSSPGFDAFSEIWTTDSAPETGTYRGLSYAHDGEYIFCCGRIPESDSYRDQTREAYGAAFELIEELGYSRIFRMWNFISSINQDNAEGLEVYRDFCLGRAEAFAAYSEDAGKMPSATGIGALGGGITFFFLACVNGLAQHVENPAQMPAYHYPEQYGAKSPSFARATHLRSRDGDRGAVYVSGTASILGHRTVHAGDIDLQCDVALENIARLVSAENLDRYGIEDAYELKELRFVKVYIRHAEHLPQVRAKCAAAFPAHTEIVYLHVDVCRSDLLVEIEGIMVGR